MDAPKQVADLKFLQRIRKLCTRLPEVSEVVDGFGHTSFRVRKKSFLIMGQDADETSIAIKCDPVNQEALLLRRGGFVRTPYIGQHGWVSVKTTRSSVRSVRTCRTTTTASCPSSRRVRSRVSHASTRSRSSSHTEGHLDEENIGLFVCEFQGSGARNSASASFGLHP